MFATTHWSVVLAAGEENTPQSAAALEQLCRTYWYPIYAYARRQGYSPEDAQDLTQGFFARLLARHSLASVDPERGRFRCFIIVALKRFFVNQRERATAAKRGGSNVQIPIDGRAAEERYGLDTGDQSAPDKLFDRAWALSMMEAAAQQLQEEYRLEGKAKLFQQLQSFLGGDERKMTYTAAGAELGLSEGAVKVAVHRMRRRYRGLLRDQVAQTVSSAASLEDELASLRAVFGLAKRLQNSALSTAQSALTLSGQALGSPGFMSPEQASGKSRLVGRRSDVYGLGAILYFLLTGRAPFLGEGLTDLLQQLLNQEPLPPRALNPATPPELQTICLKCLEKEPDRRYPTALAVAEELGRFLRGEPILSHPIGVAGRSWRWCRRKPVVASLGATALALLLVVGIGTPLALYRINQQRLAAELAAYAANVNLAQQYLKAGNLGRTRQLLEVARKHSPGTPDPRGWE